MAATSAGLRARPNPHPGTETERKIKQSTNRAQLLNQSSNFKTETGDTLQSKEKGKKGQIQALRCQKQAKKSVKTEERFASPEASMNRSENRRNLRDDGIEIGRPPAASLALSRTCHCPRTDMIR